MAELPELSILTDEQNDELIRALYRRLVELEARVLKNRHNSSKPPSSDGLSTKRRALGKSWRASAGGLLRRAGAAPLLRVRLRRDVAAEAASPPGHGDGPLRPAVGG